jgi:hypothetical protein
MIPREGFGFHAFNSSTLWPSLAGAVQKHTNYVYVKVLSKNMLWNVEAHVRWKEVTYQVISIWRLESVKCGLIVPLCHLSIWRLKACQEIGGLSICLHILITQTDYPNYSFIGSNSTSSRTTHCVQFVYKIYRWFRQNWLRLTEGIKCYLIVY